jgi:hypothetical protein
MPTHSWPKHASLRPSSRRSTVRCVFYKPPSPGKPPRAANARASWADRPAIASTPTSMSTIRAHPRERARSSLLPRRYCGPCPPPLMPEARNLHREAQTLIEQAAVQQAESSASRIRQQGSARDDGGAQGPEPSVHTGGAAGRPADPGRTPTKERLLDTRGQAQHGDARNVINTRQTGNAETRATAGYHRRQGGRYDSLEDRSPMPEPRAKRQWGRSSTERQAREQCASGGQQVQGAPLENKRGRKGKKSRQEEREQEGDNDGDEALAVDPTQRGPRPAP